MRVKNFRGLSNGTGEERVSYALALHILTEIFGKVSGHLVIANEMENEYNKRILESEWDTIKKIFDIKDKRMLASDKAIRNIIKKMLERINEMHDMIEPITFNSVRITSETNGTVGSYEFHIYIPN